MRIVTRLFWLTACLFFLYDAYAHAATIKLTISWTVSNTPTKPATDYRVEELVNNVWTAAATVPATQLSVDFPGRASPGLYTFRVVPVRSGADGIPSDPVTCGKEPPDTTVILKCAVTNE